MNSIILLALFTVLLPLSTSCAGSKLQLFGEIEKKVREGKKIISHKKFVVIPKVMTFDSSSFGRLSVKGKDFDHVVVEYVSEDKTKKIVNEYEIRNSIVENFNFKELEDQIELHRPGLLKFKFMLNKKIIDEQMIKFLGGD